MSKITDKLIDDIIELILDDMDCHHEVDHDEDGHHMSVDYSLTYETRIRSALGELIDKAMEKLQKTEVTEEFVEKHAVHMSVNTYYDDDDKKQGVTTIGKYPRVENAIRKMFTEAGVEIRK